MTSALQVFSFEGLGTRTVEEDGEIWFVAKDVAQALGYGADGGMTKYFAHVPDCWKGGKRISSRSENGVEQEREMLCLTEQGLYFFLGRSDKKKALPYQMWIAQDVVPSIRKHGAYFTPKTQDELIADPDLIIRLAQEVKAERARSAELEAQKQVLEAQAEEDKPKVVFADAVSASKSSILIGNLAKLLRQNDIQIGPRRLFKWLRDHGYLSAQRGEMWNMPTQRSLDQKLLEVKESITNNPDGTTMIHHTTKVTGKGQVYFVNLFKEQEYTLHHLCLRNDAV